jgi:hypothetical protein
MAGVPASSSFRVDTSPFRGKDVCGAACDIPCYRAFRGG